MAVGDDAVAAGMQKVPDSGEEGKVAYGAREINRTRDYIANKTRYGTAVPVLFAVRQVCSLPARYLSGTR